MSFLRGGDFTLLAHLSVQPQDTLLGVFCSALRGSELTSLCNQLSPKAASIGIPQSAGRRRRTRKSSSRTSPPLTSSPRQCRFRRHVLPPRKGLRHSRTLLCATIRRAPRCLIHQHGRHGTPWLRNRLETTESGVQQVRAKPPSFSPSSLSFGRGMQGPSGVTSEAPQHCCEDNCHNTHYHDN